MSLLKTVILLGLIGCFLTACSDTSSQPKRPKWSEQSSFENLLND